MNILIFGSQGSGKSTHGRYIAEKLGLNYFSTGEVFRGIAQGSSELALKVKDCLDKGELVPDSLTNEVFEGSLKNMVSSKGFVLDGYPRTLSQAEFFKGEIDLIFLIKVPEQLAVERLMQRAREDDNPELIRTRISLYNEQTFPVIDYYKQKGVKVIEIDNTDEVDQVQTKINDYLKN